MRDAPSPLAQPALWVRIQHRFGPRMMEWFYSFHMLGWGYVLLKNDSLFSQQSWSAFQQLFGTEAFLGWSMAILGMLRILGLVINGSRKEVTPHIRQFSAAVGCLVWAGISFCYYQSGVLSTWLAIYPLFALGEGVNMYRAARDQGEFINGKTG